MRLGPRWDHPRSRGVYSAAPPYRLISPDHPRSRGVYLWPRKYPGFTKGSSPLARGLPVLVEELFPVIRIIPARAGFTLTASPRRAVESDHPRSRGVYVHPRHRLLAQLGSSPLARGLRRISSNAVILPRIIPARAGFTLADPWNPNDDLPYQTAFTFTGDLAPAPPSCGSAVVSRRSTTTPSAA